MKMLSIKPTTSMKSFLVKSLRAYQGGRLFHTSQCFQRQYSSVKRKENVTTLLYMGAAGVMVAGLSYAAVPLYRIFCQATGYGGEVKSGHDSSKVENMEKRPDRLITVKFTSDTSAGMQWNFKPQQTELKVIPGETALAFYTATNPTDTPVVGISTYNVIPFEAGQYFNKIQCFCFEEQMLNAHEQVDMPVFFYIDPEFAEDPLLARCDDIVLSYTFFQAKDGFRVPVPSFMQKRH